jgi:chemotaxis protein CheD
VRRDSIHHKIVDIGGMVVTTNPEDVLVTYSLGSCVGVTLYCPSKKIGGMIHCMLPLSSTDPERAKVKPAMFVDVGVVALIQQILDLGCDKKELICKVAGGGSPSGHDDGIFRIGERNYAVLRKVLWKNDILIKRELVGGQTAKTMFLYLNNGDTIVRIDGSEEITL